MMGGGACGGVWIAVSGAAEDYSVRPSPKSAAGAATNSDVADVDSKRSIAPVLHKPSGDHPDARVAHGGEGDVPAYADAEPPGGEGSARVPPAVGLFQQAPRAEHAVDADVLAFSAPPVRVHHGAQSLQRLLLRLQCLPLLPHGGARAPAAARQLRLARGVALNLHARAADILHPRSQHAVTSRPDCIVLPIAASPGGFGCGWSGDGAGVSARWSAWTEVKGSAPE